MKRAIAHKKILVGLAMAAILLLSIVGLYFNSKLRSGVTVGKAASITEDPWTGGPIHLEAEETATFTVLPEDTGEIIITTPLARADPETLETTIGTFTFHLKKRDASTFNFTIADENDEIVAEDVLTLGATKDVSLVYLDTDDPSPDLEVFAQNNHITIRNLHFISPDKAQIALFNVDANNLIVQPSLPQLIRIPLNTDFTAAVKAVSSYPPTIGVSAPAEVSEATINPQENSAIATLTYPGRTTPGFATLHINATVNTLVTNTYYTLAFGDTTSGYVAFNQTQQQGYPNLTVTLTGTGTDRTSRLDITFQRTEELQPLAIPCKLNSAILNTLFQNNIIEQVYSWNSATQKSVVWNAAAPDDLESFANFRGYYVKLKPLSATERSTFQTTCKAQILTPSTTPQETWQPGWHLISLPGTVSRPLTDFTSEHAFEVHQCSQNNACTKLTSSSSILTPGKPYWIRTNVPITLSYTLEE